MRKVSLKEPFSILRIELSFVDDYFTCTKERCKLQHIMNWSNLFVNMHNKVMEKKIVVNWTEPPTCDMGIKWYFYLYRKDHLFLATMKQKAKQEKSPKRPCIQNNPKSSIWTKGTAWYSFKVWGTGSILHSVFAI